MRLYILLFVVIFCNPQLLSGQSKDYIKQTEILRKRYNDSLRQTPTVSLQAGLELEKIALKQKDSINLLNAYNMQGASYQYIGDQKKAEEVYLKLLDLLEQGVDIKIAIKGKIYNDIGALYVSLNQKNKALDYLLKAYKIRSEANDPQLSSTINNISYIYMQLEDYDKSLEYMEELLKNRRERKDTNKIITALGNISILYSIQGKYELAIQQNQEALDLALQTQNTSMVGFALGNLGSNYEKMGNYRKAIPYFEKQNKWGKKHKMLNLQVKALLDLGNAYSKVKSWNKSEVHFKKCIQLAKATSTNIELEAAYIELSQMYEQQGDFESALQYYKTYRNFQDSLNNFKSETSTEQLKVEFDTYKTEQEKKLLAKDNILKDSQLAKAAAQRRLWLVLFITVGLLSIVLAFLFQYRQRTNQKLRALNHTKDKLFALIAHDLKNPLSAFKTITASMSKNLDTIQKEEIRYFLNRLTSSSSSLYLLLQNLLEWAINETKGIPFIPKQLNAHQVTEEVRQLLSLNAEEKKIDIENHIPLTAQLYTDEKMLRTILRNLLANAIKFSPRGKKVRLHHSNQEKFFVFHVTDNGIGISKEDQKKLFLKNIAISQIGESSEKGTGLGLLLCQELTHRLGGDIWVKSELNQGTTFSFSIPIQTNESTT